MLSVFQLGRFVGPFKVAGTRVIGGFRILRRSAKCTRRPNLKAVCLIVGTAFFSSFGIPLMLKQPFTSTGMLIYTIPR